MYINFLDNMDKNSMYQELFKKFTAAFPTESKDRLQQKLTKFWNSIKTAADFEALYNNKVLELKNIALKHRSVYACFWSNVSVNGFF